MELVSPTTPRPARPPSPLPTIDPREQIVRTHLRGVWRFLRLLGCRPDDADDLTQETFVVALRKDLVGRSPAQTGAFLRWTARHVFLRRREKEGRRATLLAEAAEHLWLRACPEDDGDGAVAALRECVEELGERPRRLVHLFYGEERSRAEVAAALGLRETGVKTMLQRVRAALRDCLARRTS